MPKPLVNDGKHINTVLTRIECRKHSAPEGEPCFYIPPGSDKAKTFLVGVCGSRIKRAGYIGTINPLSLRLKTPGGRSGTPQR